MSSSLAGADGVAWRPRRVPLEESSQVGEARRAAIALGAALGLSEAERSDAAIVVTEAAGNALRHAGRGEILLQAGGTTAGGGSTPAPDAGAALEVLCLDRGPGMANLAHCLRDGYSTSGTPGTGRGAIVRLAHQFDAYTYPDRGTALLARFWPRAARPETPAPARTGAVCLPIAGETACGDGWAAVADDHAVALLVVDGLGHGPGAAAAADEAIRLFRESAARGLGEPLEVLKALDGGLRGTRGAAAVAIRLAPDDHSARAGGVGNVAAAIQAAGRWKGLVSHDGILGHRVHKLDALTYAWPAGALLVVHSDGMQTRWQLEHYPGLVLRDPTVIAGVLYRDFARGRDDVTVLVHRDDA